MTVDGRTVSARNFPEPTASRFHNNSASANPTALLIRMSHSMRMPGSGSSRRAKPVGEHVGHEHRKPDRQERTDNDRYCGSADRLGDNLPFGKAHCRQTRLLGGRQPRLPRDQLTEHGHRGDRRHRREQPQSPTLRLHRGPYQRTYDLRIEEDELFLCIQLIDLFLQVGRGGAVREASRP